MGKTADFKTAYEMANQLGTRISEAFMVLNVRQSERTTAEEVRLTQLELEQQLGGLFSLLTVEFLVPYLNRTLMVLQRSGQLPKLPKDIVRPQIVAGVNALGRGQDRESLIMFLQTIAQALGPDNLMKYVDPDEAIKRLATAQGIDYTQPYQDPRTDPRKMQQAQQAAQQQEITKQMGQFASSPMMDPTKNPNAQEMMNGITGQANPEEEIPPQA